jgi:hypothetical protein
MTDTNRSSEQRVLPLIARRAAVISPCELYRYTLERQFGDYEDGAPYDGVGSIMFVMLNPSTADADKDDPTIRRCLGFAHRFNFRELLVANIYSLRATNPEDLWDSLEAGIKIRGPEHEYYFAGLAFRAHRVVMAFGNHAASPDRRLAEKLLLDNFKGDPCCLKRNKDGSPGHPLYLPANSQFVRYGA